MIESSELFADRRPTGALAPAILESNETGAQFVSPDCAGALRTAGASFRGFARVMRGTRFKALASRWVIGFRPKRASRVAGIEA
jgi:hypothetical protein